MLLCHGIATTMATRGRSLRRPPSHSHRVRSSSANSTATLLALIMITLVHLDISHVSASFQPSNSDINIGAFNVRQFGFTKTKNRVIMTEIARIVTQFDIIAIQEIRSADVARELLDYINQCNCSKERSCLYAYKISDALGGNFGGKQINCNNCPSKTLLSSYREFYGFFYRTDTVQILDVYQYEELPFARPPFAVHVKLRNFNEIPEFLFIVVHTQPSNAPREINSLRRVYDNFRQKRGISNAIIGGDLNAGCSYWKDEQNTDLNHCYGFHWLINSNAVTNVGSRPCPYDRFIAKGKELMQHIRSGSAGAYKYTTSGNIKLLEISDHYPIGMHLDVGGRVNRSPPTCPTVKHNTELPNSATAKKQDRNPPYWFRFSRPENQPQQ